MLAPIYSRTSLQQPSMGTSVLAFVESLTLFRSFSGKAHHKGGVSVITMASQVVTATELQVLEIDSYIRGYHAYTDVWVPMVGESLLVKPEPANAKDKKAVAILKETTIVGHVPQNLAPRLFQFLRRDVNKAFAVIRGDKVNRGAGYGLEVPCIYRLYGPPAYINKMRELVNDLIAAGHL